MKYKRRLGVASTALMIVIAVTLALVPSAWAAGKYKVLYKFKGGVDGSRPSAGLVVDRASGNLYGTTSGGGVYGEGTVFKLAPHANGRWTQSVLYSFAGGTDGVSPNSGLIFDAAGNLYGTTFGGGGGACNSNSGCGVVFRLTPNPGGSWVESVLYSFFTCGNCNDGAYPSGVILDRAGNLYGTTQYGGGYNGGIVFKLTPNPAGSWTESVLHIFNGGTDGVVSYAALVFDAAGNLYGTTAMGGENAESPGVVFKLAPNSDGSWTESTLYTFCSLPSCTDGGWPFANLIFDHAGNLYGTARNGGGSSNGGVVFKLAPTPDGGWTESTLYDFTDGSDGAYPNGGLIFDTAGNLYGTTPYAGKLGYCVNGIGCGVVFQLAANSNGGWRETTLWAFGDDPGAYPTPGLISDGTGNLYGATSGDGFTTFGTVFEITP